MNLLIRSIQALTSPHTLAERLMDDRLEAQREGWALPSDGGQSWLDQHLSECPKCRQAFERRVKLLELLQKQERLRCPPGFAGRVRIAAARKVEPETSSSGFAGRGWAYAVVAAAFLAIAVGTAKPIIDGSVDGNDLQVGGAAALAVPRPNFVVRAPSLGAARTRAFATSVVEARGGRTVRVRDGLQVVLPRGELVSTLADLERRGGFLVDLRQELTAADAEVVIRFQFD